MNPVDRPAVHRPGPVFHSVEIQNLNRRYQAMPAERRIESFLSEFEPGDILLSSSFGTTSALLLHLFSVQDVRLPVYFIDTGFHFRETYNYREQLVSLLGLEIRDVVPDAEGHRRAESEHLWWFNPDLCCRIHKVEPFRRVKVESGRTLWISALRRDQSPTRSNHRLFMRDEDGHIRVHPMIHWTRDQVWDYIIRHRLPYHPHYDRGYTSIGCFPPVCTRRNVSIKDERAGRWFGRNKKECGLHLFGRNDQTVPEDVAAMEVKDAG